MEERSSEGRVRRSEGARESEGMREEGVTRREGRGAVREGARSKVRNVEEKGLSKEEKGGAGVREMAESEEELGWREK